MPRLCRTPQCSCRCATCSSTVLKHNFRTPGCVHTIVQHLSASFSSTSPTGVEMISVSQRCQNVLVAFEHSLAAPIENARIDASRDGVTDQLARFKLFCGNIGALHSPTSSLSVEARLQAAEDVLQLMVEILDTLQSALDSLDSIKEATHRTSEIHADSNIAEEPESILLAVGQCITRLFRVSRLIQKAATTDKFSRALLKYQNQSHERYNEQFDLAHVDHKFPKLAQKGNAWLKRRLGRAITERRQFLSYAKDHHDELNLSLPALQSQQDAKQLTAPSESSIQHTKATSLNASGLTYDVLSKAIESTPEDDAGSYTTVTRSADMGEGQSLLDRIPRLQDLSSGNTAGFECPFCYRLVYFSREKSWRKHVFADLRCYVCTFQGCDAPYFGDINDWFSHEMEKHRVQYACLVCQSGPYFSDRACLEHIGSNHPIIMESSNKHEVLALSQVPAERLSVALCPCCTNWADRLTAEKPSPESNQISASEEKTVTLKRFKRHLGSHLEELALFALPTRDHEQGQGSTLDQMMKQVDDASDSAFSSNNADNANSTRLRRENRKISSAKGPAFAFRICEIREHENVHPAVDSNGYWLPSHIPGYNVVASGGATGVWWICNGTQIWSVPDADLPRKEHYKTHSVFFSGGYGFKILEGSRCPSICAGLTSHRRFEQYFC
jgi:hypothetical protein